MTDKLVNWVLVICAVAAVTIAAVRGRRPAAPELLATPADSSMLRELEELGSGWTSDGTAGKRRMYVFTDVECPYCRRLHLDVRRLDSLGEWKLTMIPLHLPLAQHKFAPSGAVAMECARAQGSGKSSWT